MAAKPQASGFFVNSYSKKPHVEQILIGLNNKNLESAIEKRGWNLKKIRETEQLVISPYLYKILRLNEIFLSKHSDRMPCL